MPSHSPEPPSGNTRDEAIAAAREEYGADVRIRGVRRIRSGGVAGFFSQERYVADVVLPDAGDGDARPAAGSRAPEAKTTVTKAPVAKAPVAKTQVAKAAPTKGRGKVGPARAATPTVVAELPRTAAPSADAVEGWPSTGLSVDDLLEVALQVRGAQRTAEGTPAVIPDPVDELAELLGAGPTDVGVYSPASLARPTGKPTARPAAAAAAPGSPANAAPLRPLATRRAPEPVEPAPPAWERTSRSDRPAAESAALPGEDDAPPSPFAAALMRVVTQDDEVQAAVADAEEHEEQRVTAQQDDVRSTNQAGAPEDRAAAVRAAAVRAEEAAVAAARAEIARAEAAAGTAIAALPASAPAVVATVAEVPTRTVEERREAARARAAARRSARAEVVPTRTARPTADVAVVAPPAAPQVPPAAPDWDATSIIELAPRAGMPAAAQRPPAPAATRVTAARAGAAQLREAAIRAAGELAERQVGELRSAPDLLDEFVDPELAEAARPAQLPAVQQLASPAAEPSLGDRAARLRSVLAAATPPVELPVELPAEAEPAPARRSLPAVPPPADQTSVDAAKAAAAAMAREAAEAERRTAEEAHAAAEAQRVADERAAAERAAAEQAEVQRLEAARLAAEQAEAERIRAAQAEADRLAAERAEAERLAAERAEEERAEAERLAAEQAEARRMAAQQAAAEAARAEARRIQAEQAEARRLAAEEAAAEAAHAEARRAAAAQAEAQRAAAEQAATERAAAFRIAAQRAAAAQQAETERRAAQADAERAAAEQAERSAAEQAEAERVAAVRAEADRIAAEQTAAEPVSQVEDDAADGGRRRTRAERRTAAEQARSATPVQSTTPDQVPTPVGVVAPVRAAGPEVVEIDPLWGTPVRRSVPIDAPVAAQVATPDSGRHRGATTSLPVTAAPDADPGTEPVVGIVADAPRAAFAAGARYDEVLFGSPRSTSRAGQPDPLEALRAAALAGGAGPRRRRDEVPGRHRTLPTQVDLPLVGAGRLTALDDPAEATSGFVESLQAVADSDFVEAPALAAEVSDVLVQEMAHEMAAGMAEELARTASDPSPTADATSVLPSLSAVLPQAAPRVRGLRPPVPAAPTSRSRALPPHPSTRMRGTRGDSGDGWATITHLTPVTDGPGPGEGAAGLAALGVPPSVLGADFAAEASRRGTFAALASALGRALPAAPAIPSEPGDVLVVVGPGAEALGAARALAVALRLDPSRVLWCTRGPLAGLAGADVQVSGAAAAADVRSVLDGADVPTVVAVDVPLGDAGGAWAAQMVQAWDATAVWGVLDSTRKPAALRSWLAGLPRVDAVVVTDTDSAPDPAALLEGLPVPVAVVDGARATPHRWAALLCERLAGRQ